MNLNDVRAQIVAHRAFPTPERMYQDLSQVFASHEARSVLLDALAAPWLAYGVDKVVVIESRGFIVGSLLAERLGAGLVMCRRPGRLPGKVERISFGRDFGEHVMEIQLGAFELNDRVLICDDLLGTGSTSAAAQQLVSRVGAQVIGYAFAIEVKDKNGRENLSGQVHSVFEL